MTMTLEDRPRLMALVFALRMVLTGLCFLAVSLAVAALRLSETLEVETLLVLFSVFTVFVGLVLTFIRVSGHGSRALMLAPLVITFGDLFLGWLGVVLFLEAFRREAGALSAAGGFFVSQAIWLSGTFVFVSVPAWRTLSVVAATVCATAAFSYGCFSWQKRLLAVMEGFDRDGAEKGVP